MEAVAEQEPRRRRAVRRRAAELDLLGRERHGSSRLPTFVALACRCQPFVAAVFDPNRVGCSSARIGVAFGTTGSTSTPDSCARTCSRYPTELYAQNGIRRPSGTISTTQHFISWRTFSVYGSWKSCT